MNIGEVIDMLQQGIQSGKWTADDKLYVDFDREGGNEYEVYKIEPLTTYGRKGWALR